MKKLFILGALTLLSFSMSAQITVWQKYTEKVRDEQGNQKEQTLSMAFNQFRYSEVDSMTFDNQGHMFFWKDNQRVNVANDISSQATDGEYAYKLPMVDSVVWHRYPIKEILLYGDTLPIPVDFMGSYVYAGLDFNVEPYYTTDLPIVTSSNPEVMEISNDYYRFLAPYTLGMGNVNFRFDGKFKQLGATTVSVTMGDITKSLVYNYIPADPIYSEADTLYEAIYNRLNVTGRKLPAGRGDINCMDEGITSFFRVMYSLNEYSADHIQWIWADYGINDIRKDTWTADNTLVEGLYRRLYFNINLCNQYLAMQGTPADKRAEVRFMRAFYYYYLLDMYGNVPIITDYPQTSFPEQSTREQLYSFVEQELLACENELPMLSQDGSHNSIYRADKVAARMMLARLYLNSEVYTGRANYNAAAQYAKSVMDDFHYGLSWPFSDLFRGDNNDDYVTLGSDAAREIILAAENNSTDCYSYGGAKYLISSMYDGQYMPNLGVSDGWSCARSKKNLVNLFFTDAQAADVMESNVAEAAGDNRAQLCSYSKGKQWSLKSKGDDSDFYACWAIVKFSNLGASSSYAPSSLEWPDMAIPVIRKAEAWLTYAEAVLRGANEIDGFTALEAINTLRARAGARIFSAITLDDVLDEWGREFFAEGRRRMDLVRFGKFGGQDAYTWEGKSPASKFDANHNIFPIPANVLLENSQLVQNPGY